MTLHYGNNDALESTSLIGRKRAPSSTRPKNKYNQLWIRRWWFIHFALAISALGIGMFQNHNPIKKYLKVNPSHVVSDQPCTAAYLNVLASSSKEPEATLCCATNNSSRSQISDDDESCSSLLDYSHWLVLKIRNFTTKQTNICTGKVQKLPFAGRLTKFPDAWILPLFPLLFRLVYCVLVHFIKFICMNDTNGTNTPQSHGNSIKSLKFIVRRFCLYFMLMNFRGWVLYILFNKIEDQFVAELSSAPNQCWYTSEGWFPHSSEQELCAGRPFDFSDHIVLYYAQILPIALFETIHIILEYPYWYYVGGTEQSIQQKRHTVATRRFLNQALRCFVPIALLGSHIYLQIITTFGAYKTSVYFHTPIEIIAGYIISMTIAVPLCYLQCHNMSNRSVLYVRSILLED